MESGLQSLDLIPAEETELESSATPTGEARQSVAAILRLLWEKRRFLCWVAILAAIVSSLLAFSIRPRFKSTVRIMPPQSKAANGLSILASLSGGSSASSNLASDMLGVNSSGALYIGILKCRSVQDRIIDKFNLRSSFKASTYDSARKALAGNTSVDEDRRSGIIAITVTDTEPHRAAAIARAYVDNLNLLLAQSSTSSARQERIFLEERLNGVRQDLESAELKLSQFSAKNSTIDVKGQAQAMFEASSKLQAELIVEQAEYQGLQQIYTPDNVRVRAAKARIDDLQRSLQEMDGNAALESASPKDGDFPSIRQLPTLGVGYTDLYRQVKIDESVYELLTERWELASVEEARDTPTAQMLDEPDVPERKASPSRRLIVFAGVSGALFLAMLWIVARNYWIGLSDSDPLKAFSCEAAGDMKLLAGRVTSKLPAALRRRSSPEIG